MPVIEGGRLHAPEGGALWHHDGVSVVKVRPCLLDLPGISGARATTPTAEPLNVPGDLDVRIRLSVADPTPSSFSSLISKWGGAGNAGWVVRLESHGRLKLFHSTNGSNFAFVETNGTIPLQPDVPADIRVTRIAATGAVEVFVDAVPQPAGAPTLPGAIFASNGPITIGAHATTQGTFPGAIERAEVLDGIDGTVVASPNFTAYDPGTASFEDAQGNVWTVNGDAAIVAQP